MFRYLLTIALLFIGAVFSAQAAELPVNDPGIPIRLEEKLRQHPEIEAYASRVEASNSYSKGELGLPDPMLFFEQEDYRFNPSMGGGSGDTMLGFQQDIPRLSLREARSGKIRIESKKNQLLKGYAFAAMKAKMIMAFANLEKIKELRTIAKEQEKLLKTQRQSLKGSVAANRSGFSELSMTDAELQEISITLTELEEERHGMAAILVNLLGEVPDIKLPPIKMLAWDSNTDNTYPVAIAASDIDIANKEVDVREAEYGPNFQIRGSTGRMDNGDSGGSIMVGISIPLWASENQKPKLQGAKTSLQAAKFDQDMIRREVIQKLTHIKAQIDTSATKIALLKKKESLLEDSANAASREYEAGKVDFSAILKTRREAFSVKAQNAEEKAKHTALIADFNHYIMQGEQP